MPLSTVIPHSVAAVWATAFCTATVSAWILEVSSSATSLNFIGFDEMQGNGTPNILYNRVVILPPRPETAGSQAHPVAGFLPGQQPYIKPKRQIWIKSRERVSKRLARQGFKNVSYV